MRKILTTVLCMVLVAALSIAGTIAYLTFEDSDANVMTLGNVEIKQHEFERLQKEDGSYEMITSKEYGEGYKIQEFKQAKPLYPATGSLNGWGKEVHFDQIKGATGSQKVINGLNNVQDKFVLVENTGVSDAYVRTIIALEYGSNTKDIIEITKGEFWNWNELGIMPINGNNYLIYEAIYDGNATRHANGILPAGEYTFNSLAQVYMDSSATNEDVMNIDGNKNGTYDILVVSQAVQVNGFNDAKTALDTAFGAPEKTNVNEWLKDIKIPIIVNFDIESEKALNGLIDGSDVFVRDTVDMVTIDSNKIDGQGATVSLEGKGPGAYGYLSFFPGPGEDASVKNVNVTGSGFVEVGHYGQGNGEYVIENVTIKDLAATQTAYDRPNKIAAAFVNYGTATLKDCRITGTTSIIESYKPYDLGAVIKTNTTIIGGKYGSIYVYAHAAVTIGDGAEVDVIDSRANTLTKYGKLTICKGAKVGTINVIYDANTKPALTIEEGAKVGKITYKGVTYTQEEWLNRK